MKVYFDISARQCEILKWATGLQQNDSEDEGSFLQGANIPEANQKQLAA